MIEIKICLIEVTAGIKEGETGLSVELKKETINPTPLELKEAGAITGLVKCYFKWVVETQCVRSAHIDGKASPKAFEDFINAMGVETIAQREAKRK